MNDNMNVEVEMPDIGTPDWMNAATPDFSASAEAAEYAMQTSFKEQEREAQARELEERKQRETMQRGYEALSVGWGNPHEGSEVKAKRRNAAVDAFGEEYVSMYEQAPEPEQKRAVADRFLTDYYTEAGDEIFSPELRFAEAYGIDPNSDIKEHIYQQFIESSRVRHEFDTRIENMREEEMQWIGRYLAGKEEMTAEKGEIIVGLFGQEMVERIAKVRDASQLIEEFVKHGEGESKTAGVLLWEEAVYDAVVNPETGEMDNMSRVLMTLALRGIAEDVQAEGREANALQAGKDSLDMAVRRLLWNISNEDSAEYEAALSNLAIYERLATDEGYAASRMTQEQYDALRAKGGRDAAIRLMHAQLYDPEELRRIREELLPAARIDMKKRTSRKVVRGMLQDYVAQADASPEGTSWYKQALKGVGEMAGITAPYLIPFAGIYAGTISSIVSASDSNLNANLAAGLSEQAALNSARQDTLIAAAVELMPWSRVGGRGFNATIGRALTSAGYKPGTFAAKIADFASKGTGHAFATEVIGGVVDEGILEPLGQGLLTMSTDAAMDALGVEKAESRTFGEAFAELREVWTNPSQLAALVLFTGALTSARLLQMHEQSKEFAQFLRDNAASAGTWEALGLSDSDVRKIEASDNPLLTGRALFKQALEKDPEGVKERMRKQGLRLQEEGFTLRLTGTTGELDANAEAAWTEAYREMVEEGIMPQVERIADQNGQAMYRITERDKLTREVKSEQEMTGAQADVYLQLKMNQANETRFRRDQNIVYAIMAEHVDQLTGAAMGRELEQKGASEGLTTSDLNEAGEGVGEMVQSAGMLTYPAMLLAAERMGEAWARREQSFRERVRVDGTADANTQGTAAFRERSGIRASRNGRSVIGSMIMHAKGNARPLEYAEESIESFIDIWVQVRAAETGKSEQEVWNELADIVRRAREELIKLEPGLKISAVPENATTMHVIEAMSDMGRARFINSPLLPAWMAQVQDMVSAAVEEAAMATRIHEAAKKAEKEGLPAWQQMEEIFKSFDVPMGNIYSAARIDAQIIEQVRLARARIGGRQVATTAAEVQGRQAEDVARDEQQEREEEAYRNACPEPPKEEGKSAEEQKADILSNTQPRNVPGSIRGVFVNDSYAEYPAAGYYAGWVPIRNLRDSKEVAQVKAGSKGKHGVVNPITGEYQQETEAIYVWKRKDGTLEVISGRHKYALALENGTEAAMCYVFVEDAQHDAKWARLLDFENNMRGDQADELTAAIYVRETGYDDATLRKKGLMRNKSKSKRGILIGREARQELWDRFVNGAVNAMDAETICTMTQNVRDKSRVEEIQRRCCMLLEQGKSWDYISAMVQLMANKESVFMRQGLLDLGADFEADMERAAAYVEKCVSQLNETIGIIKSGRKLSGEKRKKAERVNVYTSSAETSEATLNDLITMREMFRNIGAYPDLVAAASLWDGKTELDAVGMALSRAKGELEQAAAEAGMTREEWEEAQAEKAAKQAAEEGTGSLFGSYSLRDISSVRSVVEDLLKGEAKGVLKDTKWGRDISVPKGRTGSKHGYGIKHIQEKRIMQGLEDDEAAFVVVCALAAAQSVEPTDGPRQKKHFERFGIRTVVAESEDRGNPVVTGFVIYDKEKTGEDGSAVAYSAQQIYALQELRSSQEVGASLGVALARFEGIVKQYPTIWERVIEFEVEKLKLKIEAKKLGSFMKAPNGQPTNLTEQQWLTVQTEAFKAWFGDSKVLDENGEPKVVYHGTARADRVGTVFRPDRATSGPMAFFTDNQAIAGNYARDKQDTSMAYDEVDYNDYRQQFRVKLPNGLDIPLHRYWGHLPFDERRRIAKVAGHIREDWEGDGDIIVDEETNDGTGGFSWNLKEARGNALDALIEEWLMSGNLFDDEARFLDVLAKLELPIQPYYKDPNYREEKVYACFMNIANPFRTGRLTKKIVASLRAASKKAKRTESQQADLWDKNSRTPERWMEMLEEDYANGTDFSWTSIPDWVTDWMKKKGYDGIVDRGGKHHDIGHTVYIPFDSVQVKSATDNRGTFDPQNPDITFSLRSMTESARVVLRRREDDVEGEELIKRWDDLLARFETASTDKHDGAAQLGTLVSLLEATRSVLPPDFAKLGRLTALMKWASVYAHMVSTGEVKRDGVLKGEIFEKFVAAMKREYEGGLLKGLSEEEAREAVQSIGERRLEDALIKVANECRARLDVFVKARARERIELMAERAYPKKERGQKSPRGKMEAIYYRAMNTMLEWMDAPAEKVVARVNELRGRLDALDAAGVDAEDKGATREELEEELRIVQLYGCWADMGAAQAKQAAEDFVTFVLTQRHAWDARLEMERRRRDYQRLRMRFTQPYNSNTRSDQKRKDSNWKVHKFSIKSLLVNTMSYAQLMLSGRKVFGEQFVRLRLQEIADANAALRNARRDRDNFFARAVMEATGLSSEGELSRWLNKFAKVEKKTGIFKREITHHTLEMERREAEEWCTMTAEERAERRAELEKEAADTGLAPSNVPSEADIDLLRKELAALDERESTAQKVKVRVPRYGQKIELKASRDAVANAILLLEQEDYQHLIEYEGFVPRDKDGKVIDRELFPDEPLDVEQTLKPLYDFIGKEGRAFAYALRRYVGQNGKQMQAVYEAQMGIPLAMKPNYWRGNFNINTIKEKDTLSESNGAVGGGGYGFLIDRVRHYNRLEWSNTATMVFGATVEMQNNYTYTSGITREWRALLSETGFQKRMEVELGRNYMTALKAWLEVIDKSKGGFAAFADIATWTQRMSRGLAYAALAGNGFVLLKQSSAILHGLMGGEVPRAVVERGDGVRELTWRKIGAAEYAAAMARTKAGMGAISLKELTGCEWFQARTDAEYKNVASRMSKLEGQKQHAYATKVAEKSMDAIGWVDRAVNLLGMQALADAVYRDMARLNKENELGLTEEQMKGEALAAVGRALTLAAQPNEASEKSLFAAQGGLISNMLFQFKSETVNKLGLLIARCYAGDWVAGIRDYMTFGAMNTLIAAALAWLRYGDEPEEDEEWKYFTKYGLNMLTGDLAAMPMVGELVQSATSAVTGEYIYQRGFIANYIDPSGIWRSASRLYTGEKGNKELDWHGYVKEVNALARRLSVLCAFLGEGATWAELMLSAAAAGNIMRTGADVANGVTREESE